MKQKQFGLIKKPSSETKKPELERKPVVSLFEAADDSDEEQAAQNHRQPGTLVVSTSSGDQFAEELKAQALKEDPNVFDYDGSLEAEEAVKRQQLHRHSRLPAAMKDSATSPAATTTVAARKDPQYMQNLLARAEERKMEAELIRLRNARKRANAEATDGEEVFVTSAYKERLRELEAKEVELKGRQAGEDEGDVSKRKDMSGFYFNLMKRNVSFGGGAGAKTAKKTKADTEPLLPAAGDPAKTMQKSAAAGDEEDVVSFGPIRPQQRSTNNPESLPTDESSGEDEVSFGPVRPN